MDNTQKDTHNEKYVLTKKMEKNGLQCTDKVSEWGGGTQWRSSENIHLKRYFSIQFCSLSCTATISFYLLQIDLEVSSKQRKAEKIPSTAYQLHSRILWLTTSSDF